MWVSVEAWRSAFGPFTLIQQSKTEKHFFIHCYLFFDRFNYIFFFYTGDMYGHCFLTNCTITSITLPLYECYCYLPHPNPTKLWLLWYNLYAMYSKVGLSKLIHLRCNLAGKCSINTLSDTWLSHADFKDYKIPRYQNTFHRDCDGINCTIGSI